ncbi:MAG: hypothetical protein L0H25_04300 [Micrococcales bacterium]|nr:hypothetical protein [Micrococcales bacterium]
MSNPRPEVTPELVRAMAGYARLPLSEDRIAVLAPLLQMVYGLVDQLDELDLGDTYPATAFDARWS